METIQMAIDGWTDQEDGVHHALEYCSALKTKSVLTAGTKFEDIMLSEISQSQKNKYT